jgi:hypothetical protein
MVPTIRNSVATNLKETIGKVIAKPVPDSCHIYTGCRLIGKQVAFRLIPEEGIDSGFDSALSD